MAGGFQLLERLPEELLQDILQRLDRQALTALNISSSWCYQVATPLLWQHVTLKDRHVDSDPQHEDHHDDTPLLRKLAIIHNKPWIGSCIHTLTHACHLPPPAIFHELPRMLFTAPTLSPDPRTAELIRRAVKNMTNVHTLRIIFGHPNINDALLRCFFDKQRKPSVRHLWLENCRISAGCDLIIPHSPVHLPLSLDFNGLESIRIRRLPVRPALPLDTFFPPLRFSHTRGCQGEYNFQDGTGRPYHPPVNDAGLEIQLSMGPVESVNDIWDDDEKVNGTFSFSSNRDAIIWKDLIHDANLDPHLWHDNTVDGIILHRGVWIDAELGGEEAKNPIYKTQREWTPSSRVMVNLLNNCSTTLTHLCLDWIFTMPYSDEGEPGWTDTYELLFSLRFPHLKSFQYRNAVLPNTELPPNLYLLDYCKLENASQIENSADRERSLCGLRFVEAHQNLQCLAWPMEGFFSSQPFDSDTARRVEAVIDNLGRTLVDLRVDTLYSKDGEPPSENHLTPNAAARERRRRFIREFAAKMTKVESIKIEGGVPRDERREVIRALHQCPLDKIVMIGVCCPIGNTWGTAGREMDQFLDGEDLSILESEHKDSVYGLGFRKPEPVSPEFHFIPEYGWPPSPPMIHTIASFHARTVRRLKFCGYKGAPVLFTPMPITEPLLAPLRHFHNLEALTMSMWLKTDFEGDDRDEDIINYWLDARNPASTSLVRITDEEPEGWEKELRTKYAPDAMAWWVTTFIGQFLSEEAKARKGGVQVRVTLCIGDWGGMFDVDLCIGKGSLNSDVCLGFRGPREELEPERRRKKLENRRWF